MFLQLISVLLIFFPNFGQNKVTIETSYSADPLTYTCNQVNYPEPQFVKCICIEGLWAFLVVNDKNRKEWKLVGSSMEPKCVEIGRWVQKMHKVSDVSTDSKLFRFWNSNHFAVTNGESWQIQLGKTKYCLPGAIPKGYCTYKVGQQEEIREDQIQKKCSKDATVLKPIECEAFDPSEYEIDTENSFECKIVPQRSKRESLALNRKKRQSSPADTPTTRKPFNISMIDEDYISPEEKANYMGEMSMMESISDYMLKNIIGLIGLNKEARKKREANSATKITPPVNLLLAMGTILKKLCPAIRTDLFTLAQEVFLKHQKTVFHIKEPYIAHAPYSRILNSLEVCDKKVSPLIFLQNLTTPNETAVVCLQQNQPSTSAHIVDSLREFRRGPISAKQITDIPQYAASDPNVHEPIVELAWKMFVIPHSHCYEHFASYFNDHHTLTTTVLPYFTNQIQQIWLYNGTQGGNASWASASSGALNYTTKSVWYNNLLGNISKLYYDLDNCYGGSKAKELRYPWFLNRPELDLTNQWNRKKRDAGMEEIISGNKCEQNPIEFL